MGVTTFTQEFVCPIAPAKMFQALIVDSHNLIPKLMPQAIKSVEIIEGDGGAGSIKLLNFSESSHFKYVKHRIHVLDKENFVCKYTLFEGDVLDEKLKSVDYEVKLEASGDGGCICKMTSDYHTADDAEVNEDEIKAGKERAMGLYKVVETYLLEHPDAY